jgi:hypothetical protein
MDSKMEGQNSMKALVKPRALMILSIALIGLCACLKHSLSLGERTVLELRNELHAGQTRMEVEIVLDRLKVEYKYEPASRQFIGIVRDVSSDGIVRKSVQLIVALGLNDRVIEVVMPEVFTGP